MKHRQMTVAVLGMSVIPFPDAHRVLSRSRVNAFASYETESDAFGLFAALGDFRSSEQRVEPRQQKYSSHLERLRADNELSYVPYPGLLVTLPDGSMFRVRDDLNAAWVSADSLRRGSIDHRKAGSQWERYMADSLPKALEMFRAVSEISETLPESAVVFFWH